MKAQELRIGNLTNLGRVYEIKENKFYVYDDDETNYGSAWDKIEPIPLTEEWLLRFGFEKEVMSFSKNIDLFGGGKKLSFSGDYLYIIDSDKQNTIPTDIITLWNKDVKKQFYVHQLQNLYFAITGEELTINH